MRYLIHARDILQWARCFSMESWNKYPCTRYLSYGRVNMTSLPLFSESTQQGWTHIEASGFDWISFAEIYTVYVYIYIILGKDNFLLECCKWTRLTNTKAVERWSSGFKKFRARICTGSVVLLIFTKLSWDCLLLYQKFPYRVFVNQRLEFFFSVQ